MENFIGEIRLFAGTFAPQGWHLCDGALLPISGNDALFSLLGTVFGGDGRTNFNLPDLRGRIPVGVGQLTGAWNYVLGVFGGAKTVAIDSDELPMHTHFLNATTAVATTGDPTNNVLATSNAAGYIGGANAYMTYLTGATTSAMSGDEMSSVGGGMIHNNMQPYTCINYIIATQGLYPPQS
jgi:microcystin-dependent protein